MCKELPQLGFLVKLIQPPVKPNCSQFVGKGVCLVEHQSHLGNLQLDFTSRQPTT